MKEKKLGNYKKYIRFQTWGNHFLQELEMQLYFENRYNLIEQRKRESIPRKVIGVNKGATK